MATNSKVLKNVAAKRPPPPNAGKGRVKGVPNKATAAAREAIAKFVDGNADRLNGWLDEIYAQDGAKAAFVCFTDLIEYHVPKLARTELVGDVTIKRSAAEMTDDELLAIAAGNAKT